MKNITLSAEPELIERARAAAKAQDTTLNAAFREWLVAYTRQEALRAHQALRENLRHVKSNPPYTREEMNER
jgi:hypothetical protein